MALPALVETSTDIQPDMGMASPSTLPRIGTACGGPRLLRGAVCAAEAPPRLEASPAGTPTLGVAIIRVAGHHSMSSLPTPPYDGVALDLTFHLRSAA